jgi:hypothetical protein
MPAHGAQQLLGAIMLPFGTQALKSKWDLHVFILLKSLPEWLLNWQATDQLAFGNWSLAFLMASFN